MEPPELCAELKPALKRVFPTAVRVILHARMTTYGIEDHLYAYDHLDRPLLPLRPLEMPELQDALREKYGGGYVMIQAA